HRVRHELRHSHGVAVAQERLPEDAERRSRDGRASSARHPARRLSDSPPVGPREMRSPAFAEKLKRGPVVLLTVMPEGPMSMRRNLGLWFLYLVAVGIFAAYVT